MGKPESGARNEAVLYLYIATLQANGLACTVCGIDFRRANGVTSIPVGRSASGAQVFACESHGTEPEKNGGKQHE
jgi:hypothetical protein